MTHRSHSTWPALALCTLVGSLFSAPPLSAQSRIGDAGVEAGPLPSARHYPQAARWADAGVRPGIPAAAAAAVRATLPPGGDIQAAIDAADDGVILLAPGVHEIARPLRMKSHLILRGAPEGATVLRHLEPGAVRFEAVEKAGLESLTIRFAAPDHLAAQLPRAAWALCNLSGAPADPAPAVDLHQATDVWLDGVIVEGSLSSPLAIRESRHVTLRSSQFRNSLQTGAGQGMVQIEGVSALLVHDCTFRDLRLVNLDGPVSDSVFIGNSFGVSVRFNRSASVERLLFEDSLFLLPPRYPWLPFTKSWERIGDGHLLLNGRAFRQGTDAVAPGLRMNPGEPYALGPYRFRKEIDPIRLSQEGRVWCTGMPP